MVFLGFSYGFPMVFLWFSYGFPMVFLWFSYGFPRFFLGFSYGFPMVFLWFSYGFPKGFPRFFLGFSYGFPMAFLWFSYGFPMVFWLNHHVSCLSHHGKASRVPASLRNATAAEAARATSSGEKLGKGHGFNQENPGISSDFIVDL